MENYQISTDFIHTGTVTSTNDYVRRFISDPDAARSVVLWADEQTGGRGQGTNRWESAPGQNLLLSILLRPTWLPAAKQYLLSMAAALGIHRAVREIIYGTGRPYLEPETQGCPEDLTIKWPNDIWWRERKLCGTLIECDLAGGHVQTCVLGVGLNVNQTEFHEAPNPVSLAQIMGHESNPDFVVFDIHGAIERELNRLRDGGEDDIIARYHAVLYRREGLHAWRDAAGVFCASIVRVKPTGTLVLRDESGREREYQFKEVERADD